MSCYNAPSYETIEIDPNTFTLSNGEEPIYYTMEEAAERAEIKKHSIEYHIYNSRKMRGFISKEGNRDRRYVLWQDCVAIWPRVAEGQKQKQLASYEEHQNSNETQFLIKYFNLFGNFDWIDASAQDVRNFFGHEIKRLSV